MGGVVDKILFQAPEPTYSMDDKRYFELLTKRDKRISAFYIDYGEPYTVLFSHGNAEDLGLIYGWFKEVGRALRVNIMSYDYTGYGYSMYEPSEEDCFADAEAAMDYLVNVVGTPASNIILWGRSLGSGPSCYLAKQMSDKKTPVAGLVLQSPLLSVYRIATYFRWTMPGDQFSNIDLIGDIKCPILVIHGTHDEIIPFWHGEELYLAIQEEYRVKPYWVAKGGHNNIETLDPDLFFLKMSHFFDTITV